MVNFVLIRDREKEVKVGLESYYYKVKRYEYRIEELIGKESFKVLNQSRSRIDLLREINAHMDYIIIYHHLDFRYFKDWLGTIPEVGELINYGNLRSYHDFKAELMRTIKYHEDNWMVGSWPHRDKVKEYFDKIELFKREEKLYRTLSKAV